MLVENRSQARFPLIASEGVPREPGLALLCASPGKQSLTGKQLGNDHGLRWQHVATHGNPSEGKPQVEGLARERNPALDVRETIRTNFIWKSGDQEKKAA